MLTEGALKLLQLQIVVRLSPCLSLEPSGRSPLLRFDPVQEVICKSSHYFKELFKSFFLGHLLETHENVLKDDQKPSYIGPVLCATLQMVSRTF